MNDNSLNETINKIFKMIFNNPCPWNIDEVKEKLAFDIKLPKEVKDTTTGEITYAIAQNGDKYITNNNMEKRDITSGWMLPYKKVTNLDDIISIWDSINFITTERVYNSENVAKSDTIYRCQNVYCSGNSSDSNNIIFCDSCHESNYTIASQRSTICNYCIRVDDSNNCANSYNVVCSSKITNSFFIQDCSDLYECIFCSHISNKRFCIANMQFEENEYLEIKKAIIDWILSS